MIRGKWILVHGTRLVWNSVRSTLRAPSRLRTAEMEYNLAYETIEIGVCWPFNIHVGRAKSLSVRVLKGVVDGQD